MAARHRAGSPGGTRRGRSPTRRDPGRGHDARREARPALRRLGRGVRRRRRRRPAPARARATTVDLDELLPHGLGQLTRPFGTAPVDPALGALSLMRTQAAHRRREPFRHPGHRPRGMPGRLRRLGRDRLPGAAVLGRHLRPGTRRADGRRDRRATCGRSASTRAWRRCSTWCATPAGAGSRRPSARTRTWSAPSPPRYVSGLESAGVVATLKHFVGYSASRAGRNLAPVSIGPAGARRRAAAAVRDGGARRRRAQRDERLHRHRRRAHRPPTGSCSPDLLRDTWGFDGHRGGRLLRRRVPHACCTVSPATWAEAAAAALDAGIDVELPTVKTFGAPLRERGRRRPARRVAGRHGAAPGAAAEGRAGPARRGLVAGAAGAAGADLSRSADPAGQRRSRPPANRALARRWPSGRSFCSPTTGCCRCDHRGPIAVIGPNADDPYAAARLLLLPRARRRPAPGCLRSASRLPTLLDALRDRVPRQRDAHGVGHHDRRRRHRRLPEAVAAAAERGRCRPRPR